MSGGRSSSRSSTVNTNETDNSNTQINDTEGLVLNFEGAENSEATIIQSDQGAIAESFNFGESALDSVDEVVNRSLNTVDDTTAAAFDLGGDALDNAFAFGSRALTDSQDFGRDVLSEAQEITQSALSVAGNAQTNAITKIRDIAESFNTGSTTTRLLIAAVVIGFIALGAVLFFQRKG